MSEYQYLDFIAVDVPVSEKNLEYMRAQSTRARVTKSRFSNEYHFGDFRGNAREMLRRGYDAHLHYANFGIRKVVFRLPLGLPCDKRIFDKYAVPHCLTWERDKRGRAGLLSFGPGADAGTFAEDLYDLDAMLKRLVPLREMLIGGDLRPLFLGWLACCNDDEMKVPPIPQGLNDLCRPLKALAEFYEIPSALVEAAAVDSPTMPTTDKSAVIQSWTAKQSKAALQELVARLLSKDSATERSKLKLEIFAGRQAPWPTVRSGATYGELRAAAGV